MDHEQLVRAFYVSLWEHKDTDQIGGILTEDVVFRGSLGQDKCGHSGFMEYVDLVHRGLADYCCEIQELVSNDTKTFAKMLFAGIHRGDFLGYLPTGERLSWAGCALFGFRDDLINRVWVLGDLHDLYAQLGRNQANAY